MHFTPNFISKFASQNRIRVDFNFFKIEIES